jgi:RNA polymerase sigma-70 factor (ECF subfamily)
MLLDLHEVETDLAHESDERILALSVYRPSVFAVLLERYQDAFVRKAEQVVGTKEDAEDVVQDTFTKIYRYAKNFEVQEGATFKSWAYKILMNTSFTHYQKMKKKRNTTVALTEELEAIIPDSQSRQFEKFETADLVLSVFAKMSAPFRNVLHMYFIEGKSQAEIAAAEGVSVGAIKTRVHRAKEEFKNVNMETSSSTLL